MDPRIDSIAELLRNTEKRLDDIEWNNPQDPRIEGLVRQVADYQQRLNNGELYEPSF